MGMFDSVYDESGNEYQTKALGCTLERWRIGDFVAPGSFQLRVLGDGGYAIATVSEGFLCDVPARRIPSFVLIDNHGGVVSADYDPCRVCMQEDCNGGCL